VSRREGCEIVVARIGNGVTPPLHAGD